MILHIDDNHCVREVVSEYLNFKGYEVCEASNGRDGIDFFEENHDLIDIVILDLVMPILSGDEAFLQIRSLDPNIPILVTSAHIPNSVTERLAGKIYQFVQKPFALSTLTHIIERQIPSPRQLWTQPALAV